MAKQLVFDEGLTLAGARRRLEEDSGEGKRATTALVEEVVGDRVRERLRNVKSGLQSILQLLGKDPRGTQQGELRLVRQAAKTPPAPAKKKPVAKPKKK